MQEKECNRKFLIASLTKQLFNCCDKHHYKAGVLVNDSEKIKLLDILINRIISEHFNKHVVKITKGRHDYIIRFANCSIFKIVLCSDSARGYRYNDLLIDSELNYESRANFGRAKIIPYRPDNEMHDIRLEIEDMETRIVTLSIV